MYLICGGGVRTRTWLGGIALCALAASPAQADESASLEELVITSDRSFAADVVQAGGFRNTRVIDTPLTVNVVPRAVLDAQGAQGLYDALRNTGGVSRAQLNGATYDNIAIRGILVENRGNYRLNGSLPVINLVEQPLEDKERVEVLKGASALYYGFVPPSGVINMTTKRPGADPITEVTVRGDEHGSWIGAIDFSRRAGTFGARVNLAGGRVDAGQQYVRGERSLIAVATDWNPDQRLAVKFDLELIEKNISEPSAIALLPASGGVIVLPAIPDARLNLGGGDWLGYNAVARNYMLGASYRITDQVQLRLEAGHAETIRDRVFSQFLNYNLTTGAGTLRLQPTRGQKYINNNLRGELSAAFATGPLQHEATAGWTVNERRQNGRASQTFDVAQNLYRPVPIAERTITAVLGTNPSKIFDRGVYVFDRVSWGDVQVIGGLRWSDYESVATTSRYESSKASPTVSLIYKPQPWLSVYGTYVEALEEGGIAPASTVNAFEVLPPAESEQIEAGAKAELGRGVVASLAWFQITRPSAFTDTTVNRFVLDGETEYRGVEFAAFGELTPELSVTASALWLDASQQRAANAALIGKRPENTPEWTASAFAEWRPEPLGGLALNAGVFYVGDRAVNALNQAFVGGYTTVSLGLRYEREVAGRRIAGQVNVENALKERYWNAAGNGFLGVGAPRTVKFQLSAAL